MHYELAAGIGEPHAAALLLEQPPPHFAFELGKLLRHRGGRDVQGIGGRENRTLGGHGMEGAETLDVQHVEILNHFRKTIHLS